MKPTGEYDVRIEQRAGGAPKFQVMVSLAGKTVGEDYAGSIEQAEHLADRMIQRHMKVIRESRRWTV